MDHHESKLNEWLRSQTPEVRWSLVKASGEVDFSELELVDWNSYRTAFGNAAAFPKLMRRSAANENWRESLEQILSACHCIDDLFPAAIPAFPFLVQLLALDLPERQEFVLWELKMWLMNLIGTNMWRDAETTESKLWHLFLKHCEVFSEFVSYQQTSIQKNAKQIIDALNSTGNAT